MGCFLSAYKIYDRNGNSRAFLQSVFGHGTRCESKYLYVLCIFTFRLSLSLYRRMGIKIFPCTRVAVNTPKLTHLIGASYSLLHCKMWLF